MEAIQQTWNGTSDNNNGRCTSTISRNGDLVGRLYLEVDIGTAQDTVNPGAWLVNSVELEIGGQRIDKHTGDWMETWAELTQPNPSGSVCDLDTAVAPLGNGTLFQKMAGMGGCDSTSGVHGDHKFFVPLQFWFCRNPGLALPLIALQYHEVKVILDHRIGDLGTADATQKLWADYIYLDTDERRRFAQVSHEYLIEQVQEQAVSGLGTSTDLNFNHPVKELVWNVAQIQAGGRTALTGDAWQLKLNGHDRFAARDFKYFTRVQVFEHHTGPGGLLSHHNIEGDGTLTLSGMHNDSIGVYSFALKPEEHQPSGTCNFSRIDNAQLSSGGGTLAANIYAVNYNVLRIMSGMGGLAYSN
tara:strand:- start:273 stop:1343 length:1071 start_codon:yes stop_codon:yes gene_type:complete